VFVSTREKFDGHEFVSVAIAKAIAAIDFEFDFEHQVPLLQVKDTTLSISANSKWWREQFTIPVIG